jgi:hypothetical protein
MANNSKEQGYEMVLVLSIVILITSDLFSKSLLIRILFVLMIFGLLFPKIFIPVRRLWIEFGTLLGKLINPLTLAILYVIIITPIAFALKIKNRDVLSIKKKNYVSNWLPQKVNYDLNYFKKTF